MSLAYKNTSTHIHNDFTSPSLEEKKHKRHIKNKINTGINTQTKQTHTHTPEIVEKKRKKNKTRKNSINTG
jgi:hypothetical protein